MTVDFENKCVYDGLGIVCIQNGQVIIFYDDFYSQIIAFNIVVKEITLDGPTGFILRGNVVSIPLGQLIIII